MGRNEKRIYKIRYFVPIIGGFIYASLKPCGKSCMKIALRPLKTKMNRCVGKFRDEKL